MSYYHTCLKCGANLDPGEKCDCLPKIFYLCDRKACERCSYDCHYTSDINHAVNFKKVYEDYWEHDN